MKVIFIYGENVLAVEKDTENTIKRFIKPEFKEFDLKVFRGKETDISDVINHLSLFPLGKSRIAVITHAEELKESDIQSIVEFIPKIKRGVLILSTFKSLKDMKKGLQNLASLPQIEKKEHIKPKERTTIEWIKEELRNRGYSISEDALFMLLDMSDEDPAVIYSFINKVELYLEKGGLINTEIIDLMLGESVQKSNFEFSDAFLERNKKRCLALLNNIKMYGKKEGIVQLLGLLGKEIGKIIQFKSFLSMGIPLKEIPYRMHFKGSHDEFILKKLSQREEKWKRSELFTMIDRLAEIDFEIKTTSVDGYILLEKLVGEML